jgi:hypothetical protein
MQKYSLRLIVYIWKHEIWKWYYGPTYISVHELLLLDYQIVKYFDGKILRGYDRKL